MINKVDNFQRSLNHYQLNAEHLFFSSDTNDDDDNDDNGDNDDDDVNNNDNDGNDGNDNDDDDDNEGNDGNDNDDDDDNEGDDDDDNNDDNNNDVDDKLQFPFSLNFVKQLRDHVQEDQRPETNNPFDALSGKRWASNC